MGMELQEIKDWVCCGSSPAHQCDEVMSVALPAKNLALAAKTGESKDVCAPCASCYSRLKLAQHKMTDEKTKKDIEQVIDEPYPTDLNVLHMLDVVVERVGVEKIEEKVIKNLNGMKVACYYGCLMTRPPKITDKSQFENPQDMENVLEALGAEPVDWNMKTFCCGASFALTQTEVVLELTKKILADAQAVGAEAISVGCPLCHANLDGRQEQINEKFGTSFNIPIFYFTELMGLSFGISASDLGFQKHLTEVEDFLKERDLL
jgi:heterodisulfide reductase subunit B